MGSSKYVVLRELSSGGMGRVFLGRLNGEADFFRPIVIKRLLDADDLDLVALFVEEARRYAVLDHENIGRIFDFERVDGELSIILEYIDGWSLVDFLERHKQTGAAPNPELCVFIVSRVCRALQYVYESAGIVHRDVSPSNIMMTREGAVKLIDFGIAARSGKRESRLSGKPAYMAPEMVVELRADNRSDLFGLGAVLYEMLTLDRLFKGATTSDVLGQVVAGQVPSPRDVNAEIPEGVVEILRKALQRDPEQRYHSAAEMGQACEHFLYDKGYGPTNLTLKRHLLALYPDSANGRQPSDTDSFPVIEPTLIPIGDGSGKVAHLPADDATRVALPLDVRPASMPPGPGTLAPRRIKKRIR